jgi:arylsulfatase A-like enzyme
LKRFLQLICGLACASYTLAAASPAHKPKPNVLLITIDTGRADHLGCYGATNIETPTLDGLAHDTIVFEHAISQGPLTWPSRAGPGFSS